MIDQGQLKSFRRSGRKWLNKTGHHSIAAMHWKFRQDFNQKNGHLSADAEFTMSDCFRQITIDLDLWDVAGRRNTIRKLTIIIDELTKLRDHVEDYHALKTEYDLRPKES